MPFTTLFLLRCVMLLLLYSLLEVGSSLIPLVTMMHQFGRQQNAIALVSTFLIWYEAY